MRRGPTTPGRLKKAKGPTIARGGTEGYTGGEAYGKGELLLSLRPMSQTEELKERRWYR